MERIKKDSYSGYERVDDLGNFEKTLTQQHFAEEVDINNIVSRALKTGLLGDPMSIGTRQAIFTDVASIGDYQSNLNKIIAAQNAFMELPADLRSRFNNDPANLLAFLSDVNNKDEAIKLGLIVDDKVVKPDAVAANADALKSAAGVPTA